MRLGDSDSYIDIDADEPVAANMPAAGDVRLRVAVHVSGFDGDQRGVWVRRNSAERFIGDLYAMARGERDDAELRSPSNRELTLKFTRPMQSHVLIEGELKRTGPGSPTTISSSVVFTIYIDAEKLGDLAETYDEAWLGPDKAANKKH
jgi:hypothetical protein